MELLRKSLYTKPPDGLTQIFERIYVFDCCFTTEACEQEDYKVCMRNIITQFNDIYPESSIMIVDFREVDTTSRIASVLAEYDLTIIDYPWHYKGCPLLSIDTIHHFIKSSDNWLSLEQQHILLIHSEIGGWVVVAFMVAALLLYRSDFTGEHKTLDMVHKKAPCDLLRVLSLTNPLPSQLRYLRYVSKRNLCIEWPSEDKVLTLDSVVIRTIPDFNGKGGCCPMFRIYGRDPLLRVDKTPKLLFSTARRSKNVRYYNQIDCEPVKMDINCHIQGDVVLECINLHEDTGHEKLMYRVMFNTAFVKSNTLMLNRDEIDIHWDAKDHFPKDFKTELLFSETDASIYTVPVDLSCFEEGGLPMEVFSNVREAFSCVDWCIPKSDAALTALHQMSLSDIVHEMIEHTIHQPIQASNLLQTSTPKKDPDKRSITLSTDACGDNAEVPRSDSDKLLFSKTDASISTVPVDLSCFEEEGLPMEAFSNVREAFSCVDWCIPESDAALTALHQMSLSDIVDEMIKHTIHQPIQASNLLQTPTPKKDPDKRSITLSTDACGDNAEVPRSDSD